MVIDLITRIYIIIPPQKSSTMSFENLYLPKKSWLRPWYYRDVTRWAVPGDDVTGFTGCSPSSSPITVVTGLASVSRNAAAVFTRSKRT